MAQDGRELGTRGRWHCALQQPGQAIVEEGDQRVDDLDRGQPECPSAGPASTTTPRGLDSKAALLRLLKHRGLVRSDPFRSINSLVDRQAYRARVLGYWQPPRRIICRREPIVGRRRWHQGGRRQGADRVESQIPPPPRFIQTVRGDPVNDLGL